MNTSKQIVLSTLTNEDVTFTLNTIVSQWDVEQLDAIYDDYMINIKEPDPNNKGKEIDSIKFDVTKTTKVMRDRRNRLIELFVTGWSLDKAFSPDEIKKTLSSKNFDTLIKEIEAIYDPETVDTKKKASSQGNSITHSTLQKEEARKQESPTSQESS